MLEPFEKALADGADLDSVARRLSDIAGQQHHDALRQIQHDLTLCRMIREAMAEPPESPMYMIAMAYVRHYRKKHSPRGDWLARTLLKEAIDNERKGDEKNDDEGN
ncbi:MAG: hypothetical protein E7325_01015 [Clostridiales bacterium]|nr:hypothetical protein [Clostridiales bacterium]